MAKICTTVTDADAKEVRSKGWKWSALVRLGIQQQRKLVQAQTGKNDEPEALAALSKLGEALGKARTEAEYWREIAQRRGALE